MSKIRLYVEHPLGPEQAVPLTRDQAHYLFGVMRLDAGAELALFNGQDGEWGAIVEQAGKRGGALRCSTLRKPQQDPPDLWLLFAPLKKARTDFVVEKAVELGVSRILPVQTEFTNAERIRQDRLQAHAVEAAEQCGALVVPEVAGLVRLDRLLSDWPQDRRILFCDEAQAGSSALMGGLAGGARAVLVGPEGGFSPKERAHLHGRDDTDVVSLGPRILRAETAALAALCLWQAELGDWQ